MPLSDRPIQSGSRIAVVLSDGQNDGQEAVTSTNMGQGRMALDVHLVKQPLDVTIVGGAGAGGTSMIDDTAFTPAATGVTPAAGTYRSVRDLVDDNDAGALAMTQRRALLAAIETPAGDSAMDEVNDALRVNIVAGAGAGGTSMVDDAAFTPGSTAITPAGAMFDDAAPDSVDEGDGGVVRMSANRNLYVTVRDAEGNERGLNIAADGSLGVNDVGGSLSIDDGGGTITVDDGGVAISVDDNGGSLTVDNAALSVVGGGIEATAQRVTIANDSTGLISVDDNAGSLTVDNPILSVVGGGTEAAAQRVTLANDSTGTLTVDNAALSVTGGGVEATALRVTIASDSTGLVSVDDGGASLTVDNPILSVVGGGTEATAQRVTIANNSTGLLSIDDGGGSLTVDGGVTADIRDGAGVALTSTLVGADQALDVNIVQTVGGAGGTSMTDDAAFTPASTPVTPIAGFADDAAPDSVDEGDAGAVRMSLNRNLNVRIRDDAGNERGLNIDAAGAIAVTDGAGSLTVDNAILSVVGGGTEAAAQRVTIANDSTGLVSVDDGGGALTVDNAGTFAVQSDITGINGAIDAGNSSVALLGIGAVFTGVSTDTLDMAHVSVFVFSNVASAADGLSVEWSTDNANWDETDVFTIPAGNAKIFSFGPPARYMRVVYTNGGVGQAAFRLQTITKSVRVKPSSHRINDPILTEDDAELVKAVLTGENPGGDFVNFGATAGGNFKTSIEEINGSAVMPVEGDIAHDAADSGNPVKIGGKAATSEPAAVANNDRVNAYFDENGYQYVKLGPGAAAIGTVTVQEPLSVDDNGSSLTVDNAALSVVGGGVEATALRVTIANDSTGLVSVDDNAGSLTVDNPILSVVGGGTEATAQRVTIANDSTGVLTVDGGVTADIRDGAGTALTSTLVGADQALDVNIVQTVGGAGGTSMTDDSAFTPTITDVTPIAAFADDTAPDSVDEGDAGAVRMSLNRNLNVRIRDDAGNERGLNIDAAGAIAVTDGGGALTVDNAALSVTGGGVEATALRVTVANDSTGVLSVDDNAGSLTVDNAALSVVGGGVEATALRVTIANDSTGLVSVDDGGGTLTIDGTLTGITNDVSIDDGGNSITVDNAVLSVVGGGTEAAAQRVTIANDSTGILTVDDGGGSLTIDGTVTIGAALPAGANNIGDVDVLSVPAPLNVVGGGTEAAALRVTIANNSTGVVTVDGTVTAANAAGDVADDAADSGNPVKIGGVAVEMDGTDPTSVSAEGDRAEARTDRNRRLLTNVRHPNSWTSNNNYGAAQTNQQQKAAPGANLSLVITGIVMSTDTAMNILIVDDTAGAPATILGPYYFAANGGMVATPPGGVFRVDANTDIGITSSAAGNHTVTIMGYTEP